jgi:DNA-binding MarR family transcriptional regulator
MMALLNKSSVPPTHREIAREAHIAASTVVRHLDRLETWGYIRRLEGVKRGIELTYKPWEWDAE